MQLDLPPRFHRRRRRPRRATRPILGTNNAPFYNFNTTQGRVRQPHASSWAATPPRPASTTTTASSRRAASRTRTATSSSPTTPATRSTPASRSPTRSRGVYQHLHAGVRLLHRQLQVQRTSSGTCRTTGRRRSKLTLDYGVRFYWIQPQYDTRTQTSNFLPERYDPAQAPRLYYPGRDAAGNRVARRPRHRPDPARRLHRPHRARHRHAAERRLPGRPGHRGRASTRARASCSAPRFGFTYDLDRQERVHHPRRRRRLLRPRAGQLGLRPARATRPPRSSPTFNNGRLQDIDPNNVLLAPPSLVAFDRAGKIPTVYAFNLGVQIKLPCDSVLDVSYVGTIGAGTSSRRRNLNAAAVRRRLPAAEPGPDRSRPSCRARRRRRCPSTSCGPIRASATSASSSRVASSNYHSLQTSLNRRFTQRPAARRQLHLEQGARHGQQRQPELLTAFDTPRIDDNQRQANYGPLDFDRRHNFIANFVWELPKTRREAASWAASLNNWQMSGVYRYQTRRSPTTSPCQHPRHRRPTTSRARSNTAAARVGRSSATRARGNSERSLPPAQHRRLHVPAAGQPRARVGPQLPEPRAHEQPRPLARRSRS